MVRSFTGFRPSPRYDAVPWNRVRIREAPDVDGAPGTFVTLETQVLSPVDSDPTTPLSRNITTDDATLVTGWYELIFLDASDNEDPADPVQYPGSGYPTPLELVAESSLVALTALTFEHQEALWLAAKFAVEEYTGQSFDYQAATTKVFNGRGGRTVYLPKRLEVLTTLEVTGSALDQSQVHLSEDYSSLVVNADAGFSNYYARAMQEIEGNPPLCFSYGTGTVTATGDWGWSVFPVAVRDAMRLDMEDSALSDSNALSETLRAFRKLGLRDIAQGGLSASLGLPSVLSSRVTTLLTPYAWQGAVGVSI